MANMSKQSLFTISVGIFALVSILRSSSRQLDANFNSSLSASSSSSPPPQSLPSQQRRLMHYPLPPRRNPGFGWNYEDPRTVALKDDSRVTSTFSPPLHVCDRPAPISHVEDIQSKQKYGACQETSLCGQPPENTTVLLLEGSNVYGRTGNNLIEFLHAMWYGKERGMMVAIMRGSWPFHLITELWMAIQDEDIIAWEDFIEKTFCVKIVEDQSKLDEYKAVVRLETRDIFSYRYAHENKDAYIDFQSHLIRTLYRSYNSGVGLTMSHKPVKDMCSALDAVFGEEKRSAKYSVIHSRNMEGVAGKYLKRLCNTAGCDPVAALDMEPEYIKAILGSKGMLDHPVLFISDHQRPEILERLLADPDIGPNIHLVPDEASWLGGDITVAALADVFIGNPASSFSGFIAKSRVALGYDNNYLFRKKNEDGEWVDVCDSRCIFDREIMGSLA